LDAQSGHETTLTALLPALAGANAIYGLGLQESGLLMDPGQLVFDNEIARMIRYVIEGIAVNDETLSVSVIKEIGPFNDFLSHPSTLKYARSQSRHEIIDRKIRTEWESTGSRDTAQSALEKAKWILENHEIKTPVSEGQQKEIQKIIKSAEQHFGYT
jgi:trimethylamine--corrinoid protein Co-methyltransferase